MARVPHDWSDDDAVRILGRAGEAMSEGGTLYVVEMVVDESSGAGGLLDLNMLVMTWGAERTGELLTGTSAGTIWRSDRNLTQLRLDSVQLTGSTSLCAGPGQVRDGPVDDHEVVSR